MNRLLTLLTAICLLSFAARAEVQQLQGGTKVKLNEVPQAAQTAIQSQAAGAQIEDIDKGTLNGRVVYEAAFKKNGQHTELRVAEDGSVIDTIVAGQSTSSGANVAATQTPATPTAQDAALPYHEQLGFNQPLANTTKVQFDQLPENVKQIVQQRAGAARIEDIDKGSFRGNTVYQAGYKKNGKHTELRVTENGKWVREVQDGRTIYASDKALAGFNYELKNPKTIGFDQLPANVKQVVKNRLGSTPVGSVRQGTGVTPGSVVYQIGYNKNGQHGELRISQDGKFVKHVLGGKVIQEGAGAVNK